MMNSPYVSPIDDSLLSLNKLLCLPKAKLNKKLNQTIALLLFGWVFGIQLNTLEKSVLANAEKSLDFIPTF